MKKGISLFVVVSLLLSLVVIPKQSLAEEKQEVNNTITCEWKDNNTTLVVSGKGRIADVEWEKKIKTWYPTLKKLVLSEGITSVGSEFAERARTGIEEIEFPKGMRVLEESVISRMYNLKKIKFPNTLQVIEDSAIYLDKCVNLVSLYIPDSVTYIGKDNFSSSSRYLKKIVLPKSLQRCEETFEDCPSLKTVVNRSSLSIPLDNCKKKKTWYVNGKKKSKVPAGKTAKAKGKKYKIKYKLRGGKAKCKLPRTYRYGSDLKLPMKKIKKKGRYLIAWNVYRNIDSSTYYDFSTGPSASGTIKAEPIWIKYTVKNVKGKKIKVYVNDKGACRRTAWGFIVRYSTKKNMSNAVCCPADPFDTNHEWGTGSSKYTLKRLKKGKKYYIQIAAKFSEDLGPWMGKKCVKVKK